MPSYLQIGDDPTKWWIEDQIPTNELTGGQPLSFTCYAPIGGLLVLSPRFATVVVLSAPGTPPPALSAPPELPEGSSICRPRPGRPQDMSDMSWRAMSTR